MGLTWIQAAEILGIHTRSLRRWRARYKADDVLGLYDRRRRRPSRRKAPVAEVQRVLRLYRERYGPRDGHPGFNVRHFHHLARRDHGVRLSYSFVKLALQEAGLVRKGRVRGRHRRRREPRPCFEELLHLDGSPHAWLALRPAERHTLIAIAPALRPALARRDDRGRHERPARGLPDLRAPDGPVHRPRRLSLLHPSAGGKVDLTRPTQLGRALHRLGIRAAGSAQGSSRGYDAGLAVVPRVRPWAVRVAGRLAVSSAGRAAGGGHGRPDGRHRDGGAARALAGDRAERLLGDVDVV